MTRIIATLALTLAIMAGALAPPAHADDPTPAQAGARAAALAGAGNGPWAHTQCRARAIHVFFTLRVCKQTDYMIQPDGHGIWVIATTVGATQGCGLLEDHGGRFTRIRTSTFMPVFPHLPIASEYVGTQYRCQRTHAIGIPGPESGPADVNTHVHVRIDNAQDWNINFNETLKRP